METRHRPEIHRQKYTAVFRWTDGTLESSTVTECSRCGQCCELIILSFPQTDALADPTIDERQREWIVRELVPLSPREVTERFPWQSTTARVRHADGTLSSDYPNFYTCVNYDPDSRLCTRYEDRPPGCRGFPFYGMPPDPKVRLPPRCSFRADVGQKVESWTPVAPPRKISG